MARRCGTGYGREVNEMGTDRPKGGMEEAIRIVAIGVPCRHWKCENDEPCPEIVKQLRSLVSATARRCAEIADDLDDEHDPLECSQQAGKVRDMIRSEFGLDPAGADKEGGR